MHWPAALNLPNFLAKTGYKEPMDKVHSNFADMDPDGLAFFPRLQKDPKLMAYFNGHMEGYTAGKMDWTDMFDVTALLEGSTLEDAPFLVDVGGNQGFDIARVLDKIPSLPPGSLIIQDLPEVVAVAKTNTVIKAQEHDFFAPQPIKGTQKRLNHEIDLLMEGMYRQPRVLHARDSARLARLRLRQGAQEHCRRHEAGLLQGARARHCRG